MMKKIKLLLFAFVALIVISTCKKTGSGVNPLTSVSDLGVGAYITLDTILNQNLNFSALATSTIGIEVTQAPAGQTIKSIILYAATSTSTDTTKWFKIKTIAYGGPKTKLTVTGQELATALGVPIANLSPGSTYTFFTRVVTTSGATFDASNTANNAGTGLNGGSNYNAAFTFTGYIVCPFVGPVGGTYKVIRDDWADWNPGDHVTVTDGPGTNVVNISQVYPNPAYGTEVSPLLVNVDPATGTASVPSVNFGNYGGGYNMVAVGIGTNGVAGYVFSCTGYITLQMSLIASGPGGNGYNNGPTTLILQRIGP